MKKYWKSIGENNIIHQQSIATDKGTKQKTNVEELVDNLTVGDSVNRRDFLKVYGFTLAAASLAACEGPVRKAIPYVVQPEEITPGIANYYASTYFDGSEYCSVLVKTREGRPIKIEGNDLSDISRGGTSARVQASVLSLYDSERLQGPLKDGKPIDWNTLDSEVKSKLREATDTGGNIVLLSSSIISPSTKQLLKDFAARYRKVKVIYYDSVSASSILIANEKMFGLRVIPDYCFDKANVIVSFSADFLGTWLSPIEYTKQYATQRKINGKGSMSRHIQIESGMSLTGSNADERIPIKPSEEVSVLLSLYNEFRTLQGKEKLDAPVSKLDIKVIAKELWTNRGKSLVISGSTKIENQLIVNEINNILDNYGETIDLSKPLFVKQGIDEDVKALVADMKDGKVDILLCNNVNPVYDYCEADEFISGLDEVTTTISFSPVLDESAGILQYVCPINHFLESWDDFEPKKGHFSLAQPAIRKLFDTRGFQDSLLTWLGETIDYHTYIIKYWKETIYKNQVERKDSFEDFWTNSLKNGVFNSDSKGDKDYEVHPDEAAIANVINAISGMKPVVGKLELELYEKISLGEGQHANNPWLQELPDPITKICWDNHLSISSADAGSLDLESGDVVLIKCKSSQLDVPVLIQPGQAKGTLSLALGYGRTSGGKVANHVGVNGAIFKSIVDETISLTRSDVSIEKTNKSHSFALTQTHHSMEGRAIVRETTLEDYVLDNSSGNELHEKSKEESVTLYDEPSKEGYHWGMTIDLNACTGCGNCVVACQAENNVPVIGKDQVRKRRIMHWIRIDRYYSDEVESPGVYHQPVMCQQCDNAPCENVCPVAATSHSEEGLNHMTYNRCIGTRYCMNNCPYKVRRFNWFQFFKNSKFDYYTNDDLGRMVLNPDVTVRSRGVAEKCSFCIQRIQEKKQLAKLENRAIADGEIQTACAQSCPAEAIVFGNVNDPSTNVSKSFEDPRNYGLLEEIHTLPSVGYKVKVRNEG